MWHWWLFLAFCLANACALGHRILRFHPPAGQAPYCCVQYDVARIDPTQGITRKTVSINGRPVSKLGLAQYQPDLESRSDLRLMRLLDKYELERLHLRPKRSRLKLSMPKAGDSFWSSRSYSAILRVAVVALIEPSHVADRKRYRNAAVMQSVCAHISCLPRRRTAPGR